MAVQVAGNGAFARACRAVDGDDDLASRFLGADETVVLAHPRFFVPCLAGAVKPYRLLFPAFVPAVRAGLRLPCAAGRALDRASLRGALAVRDKLPLRGAALDFPAGFAPLPWPLREFQADAGDLVERAPVAALPGRLGREIVLPLDRLPLAETWPL